MKGFPKNIATKQDFLNLLVIPEYKEQTIEALCKIRDLDDSMATRTVRIDDATGEAETEQIVNPMPAWKQKGFASRDAISALITEWEVK
jgi:hypothetical protein